MGKKKKRAIEGVAGFSKRQVKSLQFLVRESIKILSGEYKEPAKPIVKTKVAILFCSAEEELVIENTTVLLTERNNGPGVTVPPLGGSQE